ncbi:hypothetical protein CYR83_02345 [Ligilactobacillus agilis]|uniref:Cell surface protein n=1 Tax=Ligilactobacillus agilis TaxID=1601 RepID=A0A2I2A9B2_9LACO|nr:hypothetical protein [Ligilactobacillus agilis]PLA75979.1 hypothetical protein CYR79_08690 [Ligilactobacillus agilis]PLA83644.1 hypothetical protein CYR83_02345 [Ligilactobacillus agilis]
MTLKRFLKILTIACFAVLLYMPMHKAWAGETVSSSVTITAVVPEKYTIALDIEGQGAVEVNGVSYDKSTKIQGRGAENYKVTAAKGYKIASVMYGKGDKFRPVALNEKQEYKAPAVSENGNKLKVVFEKPKMIEAVKAEVVKPHYLIMSGVFAALVGLIILL